MVQESQFADQNLFMQSAIFGHKFYLPKNTLRIIDDLKSKVSGMVDGAVLRYGLIEDINSRTIASKSKDALINKPTRILLVNSFANGICYLNDLVPKFMEKYQFEFAMPKFVEEKIDCDLSEMFKLFMRNYENLLVMYSSFIFIDRLPIENRSRTYDAHLKDGSQNKSIYHENITGIEQLILFHDAKCRGLFDPIVKELVDSQMTKKILLDAKQEFFMSFALIDQIYHEYNMRQGPSTGKYTLSNDNIPISLRLNDSCYFDSCDN